MKRTNSCRDRPCCTERLRESEPRINSVKLDYTASARRTLTEFAPAGTCWKLGFKLFRQPPSFGASGKSAANSLLAFFRTKRGASRQILYISRELSLSRAEYFFCLNGTARSTVIRASKSNESYEFTERLSTNFTIFLFFRWLRQK